MAFNFDKPIDRISSGSMKWSDPTRYLSPAQADANPLPLWVADMDFMTAPVIINALKKAVENDILGYSFATQSYLDAVCAWQKNRFDWAVNPEWIIQTPGVVTALNIAIQAFTDIGDSVLIQPPVYIHFHKDVIANGRRVASAPLHLENGQYTFNAKTFEAAIEKDTKLFILCNPHNPTGNIWSEEELRQMGEICARHNIFVISDEIHQDLIFNPTKKHIPFARLGEVFANNCIVCTAPSKTFNIAGLQVSNIFIPNAKIRDRFAKQMNKNGISAANYLGLVACEAAYKEGGAWLEAMLKYVRGNYDYLVARIESALPQLKVIHADALYLVWIDFRSLNMSTDELMDFLTIKARIWLDNGTKFDKEGHGFMRINLGCTRTTLVEALDRLEKAINTL